MKARTRTSTCQFLIPLMWAPKGSDTIQLQSISAPPTKIKPFQVKFFFKNLVHICSIWNLPTLIISWTICLCLSFHSTWWYYIYQKNHIHNCTRIKYNSVLRCLVKGIMIWRSSAPESLVSSILSLMEGRVYKGAGVGFGWDLTGWEWSRQVKRNESVICLGRTVGIRSRSKKIHNVNCMYEIHNVDYMVSLCQPFPKKKKKKSVITKKGKPQVAFSVPVV